MACCWPWPWRLRVEPLPSIEKIIDIKAEPQAVFDLIARVEDFDRYSSVIKEVRRIGPNTYHWRVGVLGLLLEWDGVVTERIPPHRLAWRSLRGVENSGVYTLTPSAMGTTVHLCLRYRVPNPILSTAVAPLMQRVSDEMLTAMKQRLESESGQTGGGHGEPT